MLNLSHSPSMCFTASSFYFYFFVFGFAELHLQVGHRSLVANRCLRCLLLFKIYDMRFLNAVAFDWGLSASY